MNSSPLVWRDLGKLLWSNLRKNNPEDSDMLVSDEHAVEANDPFRIEQHLRELKRLVASSHNLHVLIVIRRQDTWFASAYSQMSYRYNGASQVHFKKWLQHRIGLEKNFFYSAGVRLRYFSLVQKIQDAIGRDFVTVLPYELLKSNPSSFIKQCCNAIGREVPESLSLSPRNKNSTSSNVWRIKPGRIQLRPTRLFQALTGRATMPIPNWRRGKEITLTEDLSEAVLERYRSENKKLDQDLNLGLKEYGYY